MHSRVEQGWRETVVYTDKSTTFIRFVLFCFFLLIYLFFDKYRTKTWPVTLALSEILYYGQVYQSKYFSLVHEVHAIYKQHYK